MPDEPEPWLGYRFPDEHYPTGGSRRSWHTSGWCSPGSPCDRCAIALADENPCPCCDGTGVAIFPPERPTT